MAAEQARLPTTTDRITETIAINDGTVTEGDTGTVAAAFTLTLSNPVRPGRHGELRDGQWHGHRRQQRLPAALASFAAGTTTQTMTVAVRADLLDESDELFYVNLSSPVNATIADGQGVGTIVDNDPPPALSIGDVAITKPNSGSKNVTFTVSDQCERQDRHSELGHCGWNGDSAERLRRAYGDAHVQPRNHIAHAHGWCSG